MDFKVSTAAPDATGALVVSVEGELDISTAEHLAEPAGVAIESGRAVLLDLSECSFIDSSGLREVLHAYRRLDEIGRPMVVVTGRDSAVQKMLSVAGLDLSVRVFATPEEAFAWLGSEAGSEVTGATGAQAQEMA